jgi:hypothetical protein
MKAAQAAGFGRLVGPFQEIDEFDPVAEFRFPHRDDVEAVAGAHDACGVVAKSCVKRRLVVLEDFVDAQLLDHGGPFHSSF